MVYIHSNRIFEKVTDIGYCWLDNIQYTPLMNRFILYCFSKLWNISRHCSVCIWCCLFLSFSSIFLSLPSHCLFCPSYIYNRTWQRIISCIMKSSRPVIYTVAVYYSLLSLKTLNVNEAILCSVKVWVVGVSGSEMLSGHNADSYCCFLHGAWWKTAWYMLQIVKCMGVSKWLSNYCSLCTLMVVLYLYGYRFLCQGEKSFEVQTLLISPQSTICILLFKSHLHITWLFSDLHSKLKKFRSWKTRFYQCSGSDWLFLKW